MKSAPRHLLALVFGALCALQTLPALAQAPESPAALNARQRAAIQKFDNFDGVWRGQAWSMDPTGKRHEITQTERVGAFLGNTVKMIEGRGYNADGTVGFNALGVISYDAIKNTLSVTSWAMGRSGVFPMTAIENGYVWTTPAGPTAVMRYTATAIGDTWYEFGEYVAEGQPPRKVFEMTLKRVSASTWPEAGIVPMR